MNNIQIDLKSDMIPLELESIISPKTVVFFLLNVFTAGIYGSSETVSKQFKLTILKDNQKELKDQVEELNGAWSVLYHQIFELMQEYTSYQEQNDQVAIKGLQPKIDDLFAAVDKLKSTTVHHSDDHPYHISRIALGVISFVGQILANVFTLGLFGIIYNHTLKNRIITAEKTNEHIQQQVISNNPFLADAMRMQMNRMIELVEIQDTDSAKAYIAAKLSKAEAEKATTQLKTVKADLTTLQTQKVALETDLGQAKAKLKQNETLETDYIKVREERDKKEKELIQLRQQVQQGSASPSRIKELEQQLQQMKSSEAVKLHANLGPLSPKYKPLEGDGKIDGALDVMLVVEAINDGNPPEGEPLDPKLIAFAKAYDARFKGKRNAAEVVVVAFEHASKALIKMATEGDKIKLNKSYLTPGTPGEQAIYRQIILDLLEGARLHHPSCHGFELQINENVKMLPSKPERVLQFRDEGDGKRQPVSVVRYTRRDDFTPDEDTLGLLYGVDCVGAKWAMNRLDEAGRKHLFNLLMGSVIENEHPEYKETLEYMRNVKDPQVQLIHTAYGLISDLGNAIQMKFGQSVLVPCWQDFADDFDIEPFQKDEDKQPELTKIPDVIAPPKKPVDSSNFVDTEDGPKGIVNWEWDEDVIGAAVGYKKTQEEFCQLLNEARKKYTSIFNNMDKGILLNPQKANSQVNNLTGKELIKQYYISHEYGGSGCLYKNLLANFVTKKSDITEDNIRKLKCAMAAYLDKLEDIRKTAQTLQSADEDLDDIGQLHVLAELIDLQAAFAESILHYHKCSIEDYQRWLRGEPGSPHIFYGNLSPFEIQLAAYTFNVRIGVFHIDLKAVAEVDNLGLINPDSFYGPNTKEVFYMGGTNGSYYGLFPRLNLTQAAKKGVSQEDLENMKSVDTFWKSISMNGWA